MSIAASIIGYIRQAALGEALIPFEQRVQAGMQRIYSLHAWTPVQRNWLDRLAKQLVHETVIDHEFVNRTFARDGGAKRLDKLLSGQLESVLEQLGGELWEEALSPTPPPKWGRG
jgi:type I restriction enzyme R subunit